MKYDKVVLKMVNLQFESQKKLAQWADSLRKVVQKFSLIYHFGKLPGYLKLPHDLFILCPKNPPYQVKYKSGK
jgi:hypothetical protein